MMEGMAAEALQELNLDFGIRACFTPPDAPHRWCIEFSYPSSAPGGRVFLVSVRWGDGSTYESVKADLKQALKARSPVKSD
tara:strand:+ start:179 stop:421 length:243 start_codon:yes stop_codon:yes gene_type:complete